MPQQKLDLLQLTSGLVAEPRARSAEVMGREFGNARFPREFLHHMPNGLLRNLFSPNSTCPVDSPEQPSTANTGGREPIIQELSHPAGQWDCADMTGFADQIHDRPVLLSLLKVAERQLDGFMSSQSAGKQNRQESPVSFAFEAPSIRRLPQSLALFGGQPVAEPDSQLFHTLDSTDAGRQIRTEKSAVRRFAGKPAYGTESQVDRSRR